MRSDRRSELLMRASRTVVAMLLLGGGLALGGCIEADLGELPLFCNTDTPQCPRGYRCVELQGDEYCVREGLDLHLPARHDGGRADR